MQNHLPISIAISTKDRRKDLNNLLDSLSKLDYPRDLLEIIIVEEGNDPVIIKGVKHIIIPPLGKGYGYSRNLAVKHCSNDLIAFVDDDCIVTPNWLKNLVHCLDVSTSGITGGVKVRDCGAIGYCENVLGFPAGGLIKIHNSNNIPQSTRELITCNALIRKKAFLDVGGFDETVTTRFGGEDSLLSFQMNKKGHKLIYSPNAIVYHKAKDNLKQIFSWAIRMGKSSLFFNKHVEERLPFFYRMRHSILIKALIYLIGLIVFYEYALIYSVLFLGLYWLKLTYSYRFCKKYIEKYFCVLLILPVVKFIFDSGLTVGRMSALLLFHKNK